MTYMFLFLKCHALDAVCSLFFNFWFFYFYFWFVYFSIFGFMHLCIFPFQFPSRNKKTILKFCVYLINVHPGPGYQPTVLLHIFLFAGLSVILVASPWWRRTRPNSCRARTWTPSTSTGCSSRPSLAHSI